MYDSLIFMYRRFGEDPDGALPTETHAPYEVKLGISAIMWPLLCLICLIRCLCISRILIRIANYDSYESLSVLYIYIYIYIYKFACAVRITD